MKEVVCDKKEIHLTDGPRFAGSVVELPDRAALRYLEAGAVERYETKVIREVPLPDAGAAEPLSASPVGQVSTVEIVIPSEPGASRTYVAAMTEPKKRGRPRKVS